MLTVFLCLYVLGGLVLAFSAQIDNEFNKFTPFSIPVNLLLIFVFPLPILLCAIARGMQVFGAKVESWMDELSFMIDYIETLRDQANYKNQMEHRAKLDREEKGTQK